MRIARREKDKPHPSMDVDGDGTVSQFDFKLAHRFDDDGNGILDEEETANLRAMMAKQNVRDIAKMMGAAKKTDMDFEQIKGQILGEGPSKEQRAMEGKLTGEEIMLMRNAFDALDEDHSGKIDAGELGSLSAELGQPMEAHEVAEVLTEIDADNSGQVDFNEFKAYWAVCKQSAADGGEQSKLFGGLDLGSEEFRMKIDQLAANARKMNQIYASTGTGNVMDQTKIVAPAGSVPGKIYGEHMDQETYLREVHMQRGGEDNVENSLVRAMPHANMGGVTRMENGVLIHDDDDEGRGGKQAAARTPPPEAERTETPELWAKGSDVFRMVAAKIESKTANVAKLFRKFDLDGDGTVDYRELRTGLKNLGVDLPDDKFKELCELIDEDCSGACAFI